MTKTKTLTKLFLYQSLLKLTGLTTLNVEGAHGRVKGEDGQIPFTVKDQMTTH